MNRNNCLRVFGNGSFNFCFINIKGAYININKTINLPFSLGHIHISRTYNFIDFGYRFSAISQCRNCLRTANSKNLIDASNFSGG